MARDWYGPIERFGDAFKARRKLWVLCKECGHTALAAPARANSLHPLAAVASSPPTSA